MDTLRESVKLRDGISDEEFDELLDEFRDSIIDGDDPEDAMMDTFGIEPDYLFDAEIMQKLDEAFAERGE